MKIIYLHEWILKYLFLFCIKKIILTSVRIVLLIFHITFTIIGILQSKCLDVYNYKLTFTNMFLDDK